MRARHDSSLLLLCSGHTFLRKDRPAEISGHTLAKPQHRASKTSRKASRQIHGPRAVLDSGGLGGVRDHLAPFVDFFPGSLQGLRPRIRRKAWMKESFEAINFGQTAGMCNIVATWYCVEDAQDSTISIAGISRLHYAYRLAMCESFKTKHRLNPTVLSLSDTLLQSRLGGIRLVGNLEKASLRPSVTIRCIDQSRRW